MSTGIVIVNYKTPELTIECLRSLMGVPSEESFRIIVVDNDSQDGSYEKILNSVELEGWADKISCIASEHNGGFSYGNNLAIKQFMKVKEQPEYIYLLNPDTFVYPGALDNLVNFMACNPNVGIAGSRIESEDGSPQHSAFKFHSYLTEFNRGLRLGIVSKLLTKWLSPQSVADSEVKTDWVSGAGIVIRSSIFQKVGLLDEAYFMYFEETDFCLRANRLGWECWYVPSSRIVHYVGKSSGIDSGKKMVRRMPKYWFDSRRRYFIKNHGAYYAILADLLWMLGYSLWKMRNIIQRKENRYPPNIFWDFLKNSVFFRGFSI